MEGLRVTSQTSTKRDGPHQKAVTEVLMQPHLQVRLLFYMKKQLQTVLLVRLAQLMIVHQKLEALQEVQLLHFLCLALNLVQVVQVENLNIQVMVLMVLLVQLAVQDILK